jgi:spore coat protein CotH
MKKSKHRIILDSLILLALLMNLLSCSISDGTDEIADESDIYYSDLTDIEDWDDSTHEKLDTSDIISNFDTIFNLNTVQKIRIVIEEANWDLMEQNLADLTDELDGSLDYTSVDNPMFVPSELFYNGTEWYKVGVRFKGNSSLYSANNGKLPFKLDFDEFEDTYEEIKNQRFYGFKQLSLKNNYNDESEMHEVVANELFRDFGLISAHCAFYELYINIDDGTEGSDDESNDIYYGLYTLVEEVDDTVIKTQYGDDNDSGNLYKPDGDAATFASGTYDEDEFGLQTDDESYTDVLALYDAVNNSSQTVSSDAWIDEVDAVFDVDIFLKWLAANTVMQNWDTYGVMSQNFFLYSNPSNANKLEWIPWDSNEALESNSQCLSLDMTKVVESDWPLIGYILANATCKTTYKQYVDDFADNLFYKTRMQLIYEGYETQISDYVGKETSYYRFTTSSLFTKAVDTMIVHAGSRNSAANTYAGID